MRPARPCAIFIDECGKKQYTISINNSEVIPMDGFGTMRELDVKIQGLNWTTDLIE